MTLFRYGLLCGMGLLASVTSQEQAAVQQKQNLLNKEPSIQVFLTALIKSGLPVTPDQSALSVSVDKSPAQVSALRPAGGDALLFAVMVDMSGSENSSSELIKKAAVQLFQGLSAGKNRGYLVLFNDVIASSNQALQVPQVKSVLNSVRFHGGTAIYDAIQQTCLQKLSRSGNLDTPRRAILLISDGDDDASQVTHTKAEEAAEREGVAVFSLMTRSSRASTKGEHFLQALSHDTGGQAISSSNMMDGIASLLSAIENQWAVTFLPAQPIDRQLHSLDIKTSQEDVKFSAPVRVSIQ